MREVDSYRNNISVMEFLFRSRGLNYPRLWLTHRRDSMVLKNIITPERMSE